MSPCPPCPAMSRRGHRYFRLMIHDTRPGKQAKNWWEIHHIWWVNQRTFYGNFHPSRSQMFHGAGIFEYVPLFTYITGWYLRGKCIGIPSIFSICDMTWKKTGRFPTFSQFAGGYQGAVTRFPASKWGRWIKTSSIKYHTVLLSSPRMVDPKNGLYEETKRGFYMFLQCKLNHKII